MGLNKFGGKLARLFGVAIASTTVAKDAPPTLARNAPESPSFTQSRDAVVSPQTGIGSALQREKEIEDEYGKNEQRAREIVELFRRHILFHGDNESRVRGKMNDDINYWQWVQNDIVSDPDDYEEELKWRRRRAARSKLENIVDSLKRAAQLRPPSNENIKKYGAGHIFGFHELNRLFMDFFAFTHVDQEALDYAYAHMILQKQQEDGNK